MKIIKFDTLYPSAYIDGKINDNINSLSSLSFDELNDWLISLRINFSDYYTYNLRLEGWDAKEFFVLGKRVYVDKMGLKYYGRIFYFIKLINKIFGSLYKSNLQLRLIDKVIRSEKPDVIFIREQSNVNSLFWDKYRNNSLVVSRMECSIPKYWSPACFDVIYTNINTYRDFFLSNRFTTKINYSGFDERICREVAAANNNNCDVVFGGGLGNSVFLEKTLFFENLLSICKEKFSFAWWGYKENDKFDEEFPLLSAHYRGLTGGLEMFEIYKSAKIVLNDYGLLAGGQGMNQRIYEVMGVGAFLLTRNSKMFNEWGDSIATFDNTEDCLEKIIYYISHEEERLMIAQKGHEYVMRHFNYKNIMKKLSDELKQEYEKKFNKKLH